MAVTSTRQLYHPLEHHDSIRLFNLHQSDNDDAPLKGDLFAVRLSELPTYQARSYMWGPKDKSTERPLIANGMTISLRANLARALWSIREHRRKGRIRKDYSLWVDLICIQQDCIVEKSHQVQQMGTIYANADTVWIWLGDETRVRLSKTGSDLPPNEHILPLKPGSVTRPENPAELKALYWALLNKHWTRTWILQEICLAQRVALMTERVIYEEAALQEFPVRKVWLEESNTSDRYWKPSIEFPHPRATAVSYISKFEKVLRVRESIMDPRWKRLSLCSTICQLAETSECFELRDKVFAFLSMAEKGQQIKVDYNIDTVDLFWNVIRLLELREIHFQEISALRDILKLDWTELLARTRQELLSNGQLRLVMIPCLLDCGRLSKKRERNANARRPCRPQSYIANCWYQKDLGLESSPQIMVQFRLKQVSETHFLVSDAAYCPDEGTKIMYQGLNVEGCSIQVLDTTWNDRREFVAVDPVLWITLSMLADSSHGGLTSALNQVFPQLTSVDDKFFRHRKASKEYGMVLQENS